MARIKNIFVSGKMDKDTDRAFVNQGLYRHAENLRFQVNDGNDGIGSNIKGSSLISDSTEDRTDLKCITALHNEDLDVIYYYLASTSGQFSKIVEYDIKSGNTTDVLHDTNGVLNLDKEGYITGINEIDGLLYWAEWDNNPRRINVERAKTYGLNGFTEDDIKVIVKPPLQKLRLTLEITTTNTQQENIFEDRFVYLSYRYRYLDGEYSALAKFSKPAFLPNNFSYDFSEQSNRSMINKFNQIKIEFNTGSERVTDIQLVYKESESSALWVIDDFNKELLGYGNNEIQIFNFFNKKTQRLLGNDVLLNTFDNVPKTAKAQQIIDGRLLYAHYKENYDIVDCENNNIEIDYSLELEALNNTMFVDRVVFNETTEELETIQVELATLEAKRTIKSNRDYEVGIVYGDEDGRITTILNSKNNTIYVPPENSVTENSIDVLLKHNPPCFATYYHFFIKQSTRGYDQIIPTLFYEDGVYRWIKLEGADKDKIKEGDYLIVKSDTQSVIDSLVKVKVLELTSQEKNFLQPEDVTDIISERSGLYIKIKPDGFRIDLDDYETYLLETYDTSRNRHDNTVSGLTEYISPAHFYGDTLNNLTSGGVYTGGTNDSIRFLVEIDGLLPSTFRWSIDDGANFIASTVAITPNVAIPLQDGVTITFDSDTGHSLNDSWNINATAPFSRSLNSKAYGFFRTVNQNGELLQNLEDEKIFAGARIRLSYDEYEEGDTQWEIDTISNGDYDNIQEWFYKEDIFSDIAPFMTIDRIHFVRGVLYPDDGAERIVQDLTDGTMTMVIQSVSTQNNDADGIVKIRTSSEIIQSNGDTRIVFETEPADQPPEIYYEIGKNYRIINGFHSNITDDFETEIENIASDQIQTATQDLRVKLDWFNAYSYGNAVESYKIRDEFNSKGIDLGVRTLTNIREEYKEVTRISDITWSDVYNDETDFNGLNTFNLSQINFVKLDKEEGSIQKLERQNSNLIVYQEDAIGIMPYNKQIINDVNGGQVVGISTNILNRNSYRPYSDGLYGVSKHPESIIKRGNRIYNTDQQRGNLLRLANNGITEINQNLFEYEFSNLMIDNKEEKLVAGFDPKHNEYVLYIPSQEKCLIFKEGANGFPAYFTFEPDFMLGANNEFYAWKDGVMYLMNSSENRNGFFGTDYESKIKFFVNQDYSVEKIFNTLGIESTHPWLANLNTRLTSRTIPKECFIKKEDYWFSEIMTNTNDETESSNILGLGNFAIVNGEIITTRRPESMSIGDEIISSSLLFVPNKITDITDDRIILETSISTVSSFLMYKKNQNVDGTNIRGDILEVELINNDTDKVEIRAVNTELSKSFYS